MRKAVAGMVACWAVAAQAAISIPNVNGIEIDGKADDWRDLGTKVEILHPGVDMRFPASEFDASFRAAWDQRGLLLLVNVKDAAATEAELPPDLWQADCLELFLADKPGSKEWVQLLVAPGRDARFPEPRQHARDQRSDKAKAQGKPEATIARTKTDAGYLMEILLPWSILQRQAKAGDTLAFQLYANTKDKDASRRKLIFYPKDNTHESTQAMHELVLSDKTAMHLQTLIAAKYDRYRRIRVDVLGTPAMVGKSATVKLYPAGTPDMAIVQQVTLSGSPDGRSSAKAIFPIPAFAKPQVSLSVQEQTTPSVELPDLAKDKAQALLKLPVIFRPSVFSGIEFPKADFENPEFAETLIGPYELQCTFYDAEFNPVSIAKKPGRYGAVVEIQTADGRTLRRFQTLYRTEKELKWWEKDVQVRVQWPTELGLDERVAQEQASATDETLKWLIVDGAFAHGMGADLLAGLRETKPGTPKATIMTDAAALDRAWWVDLKRKLYGTDQRFTEAINRPLTQAADPAPVLRFGTEAQAGFKPGTKEALEAILRNWAENSDEGFTVCVARNGIKIIDSAYGIRAGKPMTPQTPSIVYSISKAISGTAIMMAVDQGLLSLDDTPDKFLPPFRTAKGKQPTLRQLFTHTAGMEGHWGDEQNDFEELIAEHLSSLEVGKKHQYNGASLALGCKVLEQISGESLPEFYAKHIFTPLGMNDTASSSCSWRTWSTASDLAKLGQMLLNRGSYGDKRFLSTQTFAQMLPHKLEKELGPDSTKEWGIGLSWMNDEKTFWGHGSASSSTFFISPERGLVITMARNGAGKNFAVYHKQFIAAIEASLAEDTKPERK